MEILTRIYNIRKFNWPCLRETFINQSPIELARPNELAKFLLAKLKRAMDMSIPKVRWSSCRAKLERCSYLLTTQKTG